MVKRFEQKVILDRKGIFLVLIVVIKWSLVLTGLFYEEILKTVE